jgi:hypothetical protein
MSSNLSGWLAGEDLTTPANDRHAVLEHPSPDRASIERAASLGPVPADVPRRGSRTDGLAFLAAAWVVIAAVPVAYLPTGRFDMLWNDAMVGIAACVVTMTRIARPGMAPTTTGITCALGGWLVVAPFVLHYGDQPFERLARWSDVTSGAAIVALSLATMVAARARSPQGRQPLSGLAVGAVEPADP